MQPSLWARVRALFGSGGQDTELVLFGNAFAALGVGVAVLLSGRLSPGGAIAATVASFLFLTGCVLYKPTLWIPACVGGASLTVGPTVLLAGIGIRIAPAGAWVGGVLGLLLGFAFAFRGYVQIGKLARSSPRSHSR